MHAGRPLVHVWGTRGAKRHDPIPAGPTRFGAYAVFAFVLIACLVCFASGANRGEASSGVSGKPNVVFLIVDDLNDWVGFLDACPGAAHTPHMDRLAAEGLNFRRAYCAAPLCNPSRVAVLTGIRPSTSGVYLEQPWRPVLPDAVTLPMHFKNMGYEVAGFGKIFHGGRVFEDPGAWHTHWPNYPWTDPANRGPIERYAGIQYGALKIPEKDMGDVKVADRAIAFLLQKHDRPFFLAVGIFRPHAPWYVPARYLEQYPLEEIVLPDVKLDDLDDIPPIGMQWAVSMGAGGFRRNWFDHPQEWKKAIRGYLASISFADEQVGGIMDALHQSGHRENTIVVLWGDHGYHLGEKLCWHKTALWEKTTRVPLLFSVPGLTRPQSVCERTVSLLDVYPTLCVLAGLPLPEQLEGESLVPLLRNPHATWEHPAITTMLRNNHSIRTERWRYIRYRDGEEELYDHRNDPMEWKNLADVAGYQDVKRHLSSMLPTINADAAPGHARKKMIKQ